MEVPDVDLINEVPNEVPKNNAVENVENNVLQANLSDFSVYNTKFN